MEADAREADPARGLAEARKASTAGGAGGRPPGTSTAGGSGGSSPQGSTARGRPHPAVAAVRLAVRRGLAGLPDDSLTLAACSGGADSLALAAALAFEAPKLGLRAGAVTVDHGLQEGSAARAERVADTLRGMGLDPVLAVSAQVAARASAAGGSGPSGSGASGYGVSPEDGAPEDGAPEDGAPGDAVSPRAGTEQYRGPEAAARVARYAALETTAASCGATVIMFGHTMDDQAETVLLGLARGSGARSIAGMAPVTGRYLRPLLGLRRSQTRAACAALGLQPWDDPHNLDHAYARTRVREQILPLMEELIGPGVTEALARTADQLRADADVLDELTRYASQYSAVLARGDDPPEPPAVLARGDDPSAPPAVLAREGDSPDPPAVLARGGDPPDPPALEVAALAGLPAAIRTRLLHKAAIDAGVPAGSLTARHVAQLDALVTGWHGQRWIDLPGGVRCRRQHGRLLLTRS